MIATIGHKNLNEADEVQRKTDEQAMKAVNSLFNELFIIYPAYLPTLRKTHPDDFNGMLNATKKLWLKKLQKHKITPKMLKIGITKAEDDSDSYFPNPAKFIEMCYPTEKDLGIPMMESAYIEACQHTRGKKPESYSHVIVYEAGSMTGFFELASKPATTMRPLFKANYNALKEKLVKGEQIHVISNAIADMSNDEPTDPRTAIKKESDRKKAGASVLDQLMGRK